MTHAAVNYTGFPAGFLRLGPGLSVGRRSRRSCRSSSRCSAATSSLLHRSVVGRALYAIGFTPAGARYAGIPVATARRARLRAVGHRRRAWRRSSTSRISGQARSDAGHGLRARCDHGGRARRHVGVRRTRHAVGHAARACSRISVLQKRPAARGAAVGADGRADGRAAASRRLPIDRLRLRDACRPLPICQQEDDREEQSGRGALRHDHRRRAHRRRHERVAGAVDRAGGPVPSASVAPTPRCGGSGPSSR